MGTIKSWNCTFTEVIGNEIYNIVKVICPWYEDEFVSINRSNWINIEDMVENYISS